MEHLPSAKQSREAFPDLNDVVPAVEKLRELYDTQYNEALKKDGPTEVTKRRVAFVARIREKYKKTTNLDTRILFQLLVHSGRIYTITQENRKEWSVEDFQGADSILSFIKGGFRDATTEGVTEARAEILRKVPVLYSGVGKHTCGALFVGAGDRGLYLTDCPGCRKPLDMKALGFGSGKGIAGETSASMQPTDELMVVKGELQMVSKTARGHTYPSQDIDGWVRDESGMWQKVKLLIRRNRESVVAARTQAVGEDE